MARSSARTKRQEEKRKEGSTTRTSSQGRKVSSGGRTDTDNQGHANEEYLKERGRPTNARRRSEK
jgi:hypothetical protein